MVRLDGPSPACSSRNRARLLAFRSKQDVVSKDALSSHAAGLKQYWSTLTTDAKLSILRFEDRLLVEELYDVQQSLYAADLDGFFQGLRGQEKVQREAGTQFFDVEGVLDKKGILRPKAFIAKREFVEMENLFDFIEERLGRPLFEGAPHLEQPHWPSLLKPKPTSWVDFVRVALSLVELALRKSLQEAPKPSSPDIPSGVMTQSAKRKARKKRTMLELAAEADAAEILPGSASSSEVVEIQNDTSPVRDASVCPNGLSQLPASPSTEHYYIHSDESSTVANSPISKSKSNKMSNKMSNQMSNKMSNQDEQQDDFHEQQDEQPDEHENQVTAECCFQDVEPFLSISQETFQTSYAKAAKEDSWITPYATFDPMPLLGASQSLRQSAREARISAVVAPAVIASTASRASASEAWVRAEFQMREQRGRSRTPWLLADGSSGENWVEGFRATVKNTFLDVEMVKPESSALRAHSWPALESRWSLGGA